ncbi:MAG: DUF4340 domain-containing protein [Thermoanaerobaculia bacterium]|nr:DUF4340 domain-containing protein [Thermoanaerobaculia bacterium]
MKPKTLAILAVVTAALGAFVYFVERDLPSTDEKKELETQVLALEADDVTAVTLRAEGREVRLERVLPEVADDEDDASQEPEWHVAMPQKARADAQAVLGFLGELIGLRIERSLENVDTTAAGLDEPRFSIVVSTSEDEATLEVGADVPLSEDALVRVTGETGGTAAQGRVVQTGFGESLREKVAQSAGDWRDKRLFFGRQSDVQRLAWMSTDGRRAALLRAGDGEDFLLDEPIQDRADRDRVRGLLSSLAALEAASFEDGEEARSAFAAQARFEITMTDEEAPWQLELAELEATEPLARVGGEDGQLVRLISGPVTEAVVASPESWRSTAWTHLPVFRVDEAILDQVGEELLAIRRHESDWLRTLGDTARVAENAEGDMAGDEVPYTAASNVLYPLSEVRAERLLAESDAVELDLEEPQLRVTLVNEDGEENMLLYGLTDEGLFAARAEGRDVVLLLPAEKVDELLEAVKALRDAEPVPPPADAAAEDDVVGDGT